MRVEGGAAKQGDTEADLGIRCQPRRERDGDSHTPGPTSQLLVLQRRNHRQLSLARLLVLPRRDHRQLSLARLLVLPQRNHCQLSLARLLVLPSWNHRQLSFLFT